MPYTPGKFEGEPVYVPTLWDGILDGGSDHDLNDDDGTPISFIVITPDDVATFPELAGIHSVKLWETEQGFVHSQTFADDAAMQAAIAEIEDAPPTEPQPEDYTISSWSQGYTVAVVEGKAFGTFIDQDDAENSIREHAGKNFRPSVWFIDDHGGSLLLDNFEWEPKKEAEPN